MNFDLDSDMRFGRDSKFGKEGLTFDDVLLVPAESSVLPNDVRTATRLTRTVVLEIRSCPPRWTRSPRRRLAIAIARSGGIGILHRNLSIADQVAEVDKVKRSESGMIVEPVTLRPDDLVADAVELMERYHISGVPITDEDGILVGILTNRDLRFETNLRQPVSALMTSRNLVTAPVGTGLDEANEILHRSKIEKLPVVDADGRLKGLITVKDIRKRIEFPLATKDEQGRLRVGAAVGVGPDALERAGALVDADVDVLVVDTAHGHSRSVIEMVRPGEVGVGRPGDRGQHRDRRGGRGADRRGRGRDQGRHRAGLDLHDPDRRRRRRAAGHGDLRLRRGGGPARRPGRSRTAASRPPGDIAKAVAAGADTVMTRLDAGRHGREPGRGRPRSRASASRSTAAWARSARCARARSRRTATSRATSRTSTSSCPRGSRAACRTRARSQQILYQLVGGLRQAMGYCGAATIEEMKAAQFVRITGAGLRESHPHDLTITKEAPNYRRS